MTFIPATGGGGGSNVFTYREAEPSPTGNVFATFAAAYAARAAFVGPADILIDDTLSPGNATIHAGNYDFNNTTLRGMQVAFGQSPVTQPLMTLTIADEVITVANLRDVRDLAIINASSHGPVMTTCNANQDQLTFRNASLLNNAVPPFLALSGGATNQFNISLLEGSTIQNNGGPAVKSIAFMSYVLVIDGVSDNNNTIPTSSKFFADCFSDDGTFNSISVHVSNGGDYDSSQPHITGTPSLQFFATDQEQLVFFNFDGVITDINSDITYVFFGFTAGHTLTIPPAGAGRIKIVDGDGSLASNTLTIIGTVDGVVNPVLDGSNPGSRGSRTIQATQLGWLTVDQRTTGASGPTLTAGFTQPAAGATVTASVSSSTPFFIGEGLSIPGGGFYVVTGLAVGLVTLRNTGAAVNAVAGVTVGAAGTSIFDGTQQVPFALGQLPVDGPISVPGGTSTGVAAGTPLVASKGDNIGAIATFGTNLVAAGNEAIFIVDPSTSTYRAFIIGGQNTPTPIPAAQTPRWVCPVGTHIWIFSDDGTNSFVTVVSSVDGTIVYANFNVGAFLFRAALFVPPDNFIWATTSNSQFWGFPVGSPPSAGGLFHTETGLDFQQGGLAWDGTATNIDGVTPNVWTVGFIASGPFANTLFMVGWNDGSPNTAQSSGSTFGATPGVVSYGMSAFGTKQLYVLSTHGGTSYVWIYNDINAPASWTGGAATISSTETASGIHTDLGSGDTVVALSTNTTGNTNQRSAVQISGGLTPVVGSNFTLFPTGAPGPDPGIMQPPGVWWPVVALANGSLFSIWTEESSLAYATFFTAPAKQLGLVSSLEYSGDLGTSNVTTLATVKANTVQSQHTVGGVTPLTPNGGTINVGLENVAIGFNAMTSNGIVMLPATPTPGQEVEVKDVDGSLPGHNITINGNGNNVEGSPTFVMNSAKDAFTFRFYNSTLGWGIV